MRYSVEVIYLVKVIYLVSAGNVIGLPQVIYLVKILSLKYYRLGLSQVYRVPAAAQGNQGEKALQEKKGQEELRSESQSLNNFAN